MRISETTNAVAAHLRNYLIAATSFTAGRAILQNRSAIAQQFDASGAISIPFGIEPIMLSIFAGISLAIIGMALTVANVVVGGLFLLEASRIPNPKDAKMWQRLSGFVLLFLYMAAVTSVAQILLVLGVVRPG
ncbi:hypothetical protein [Celeribacter ethanolicus]|uniref:hypothetical protein n=1 Tax=Celeribacter ethanolicus TaxID=1758178 RepID=UPI0012DDD845|nr:hypothetical protein [Celeribacter ethanolicus]